jgi:hypothetical protein
MDTIMKKVVFFLSLIFAGLAACLLSGCGDGLLDGDETVEGFSLMPGTDWPVVSDAYEYPGGPFASYEAFMEAQQIPSDVLNKMSTPGVIYSFVHAPGLPAIFMASSDSPAATFYKMYDGQFNSAREILSRPYSGEPLFAFYKAIGWDSAASADEVEQGYFSIRVRALEYMFSRGEILRQFSLKGKKNIVRAILSNYKQLPNRLPAIAPSSDALVVIASVMYEAGYAPLVAYARDNDILSYVYSDQESDVIALAENFIQ